MRIWLSAPFCLAMFLASASAQIPVNDVGDLPRHTVENEHVPGLLVHSNFRFVGRSNPHGPYVLSARNWTDVYGYAYDGTDPQFAGRRYGLASTGGFTRRGNFLREHGGGVAIFDVTADDNPEYFGTFLPSSCATQAQCLIRDVEVHDGIGYFSSDRTQAARGGVFVVDLRADPTNPTQIAHLNSVNFDGLNAVHEIGVDIVSPTEAYLYANDSTNNGRISVYDISDARAGITKVAEITGISTHGVFAENGRLFVSGDQTLTVMDVSDIGNGNFSTLGIIDTPGGFTHSGWSDTYVNDQGETRNVFYLTHEAGGTDLQVWDVTDVVSGADPNGASQIAAITNLDLENTQGTGRVTNSHNTFLVDDTLYLSWTVGGMVVLDVEDPENPTIIDTFDTTAVESLSNFAGAFGVNPSLGPDRVLITDRATGLWVVDVS